MTEFIPILPNEVLVPVASGRQWHLVLAQMMETNEAYRNFYLEERKRGAKIILDNGAYELGASVDDEILARWAAELRPEEVVLPDVMFRGPETLRRSKAWMDAYGSRSQRYMIVPQADNVPGWFQNLRHMCRLFSQYELTIGVPKHLSRQNSNGLSRLEYLAELERLRYHRDYPVHLLGSDDKLQEASRLGQYPWVRSFDSAKPAIWAYRCCMLDPRREPPLELNELKRPEGFFDLHFPETFLYMVSLTKWNVNAVETWLRAGIPVAYGVY